MYLSIYMLMQGLTAVSVAMSFEMVAAPVLQNTQEKHNF